MAPGILLTQVVQESGSDLLTNCIDEFWWRAFEKMCMNKQDGRPTNYDQVRRLLFDHAFES